MRTHVNSYEDQTTHESLCLSSHNGNEVAVSVESMAVKPEFVHMNMG
jgi:hypothetical protein